MGAIMVYCVGLTGTIASGKSTATAYFASQGIATISADKIAKDLTKPGQAALDDIREYFGHAIFHGNGELNRRQLRDIIMRDQVARQWLESCLHPRIRDEIKQAISHAKSPYCVIEIPLLIERTHYPYLSRVLLIEATEQEQIKRLMARDNCTSDVARACLAAQPYHALQKALADDCIQNNGSYIVFEQALLVMHQKYLSASQC
jgi:dephospho-CoA kinase